MSNLVVPAAVPVVRPRVARVAAQAEIANTGAFSEGMFSAAMALLLVGASLYGYAWRPVGKHWGR